MSWNEGSLASDGGTSPLQKMHSDPGIARTQKTWSLGLVGFPVGHSLSPRLHQAALESCGLMGEYHLYPIPPGEGFSGEFSLLLEKVRAGEVHGLNVTIPHKKSVLPYVDILAPAARAVQAVNTLYLADDSRKKITLDGESQENASLAGGNLGVGRRASESLVGDNTDVVGFLADLTYQLDLVRHQQNKKAVVLGAGGSARAVVYALVSQGWQVTLAARRVEQAQALVEAIRPNLPAGQTKILTCPLTMSGLSGRGDEMGDRRLKTMPDPYPDQPIKDAGLVVNTTPLGMWPETDGCPWPEGLPFPAGAFIYDLIYNPRITRLVNLARRADLPAVTGLGMLIEQAIRSFELWTGLRPPREVMWHEGVEYNT